VTLYERWTLIWYGLSAISTAATAIIVFTAALFTYRQVKEASRARQLESALAVLTYINSPDIRNARRLVFTKHEAINREVASNPTWEELDSFFKRISGHKVDLQCFHSYLASLENVSILVLNDLAPDNIIEMYFARMAPHHWTHLQDFIVFLRNYYHSDDFLQHFEMLNELIEQNGLRGQMDSKRGLIRQMQDWILMDRSERIKQRLLIHRRQVRKEQSETGGLQYLANARPQDRTRSDTAKPQG
jgi:hypothetical protein